MYYTHIFLLYIYTAYQTSDILLKANLTAFPLDKCNASLLGYDRNSRALPNGIQMGQICAHDPNATRDACQVYILCLFIM